MSNGTSRVRRRLILQRVLNEKYHTVKSVTEYKQKVDKYKEMYELAEGLLNPDTRRATAFKKSLDYVMERAGSLLGKDLTKHPYYVLNKPALDTLSDLVRVMDTIDNARAVMERGETQFAQFTSTVRRFTTHFNAGYRQLRAEIEARFRRNSAGRDWIKYLRELNRDQYDYASSFEALNESLDVAIDWVPVLLRDIRIQVDKVLHTGPHVVETYGALVVNAGKMILAEKTYHEKIEELVRAKKVVDRGLGSLEQRRRALETWNVRESLHQRVWNEMQPPGRTARRWTSFMDECLSLRVLKIGSPTGTRFPWEIAFPAP